MKNNGREEGSRRVRRGRKGNEKTEKKVNHKGTKDTKEAINILEKFSVLELEAELLKRKIVKTDAEILALQICIENMEMKQIARRQELERQVAVICAPKAGGK